MTTKSLLVISEHFYPSTGATAQLVTDLVSDLANYGLLVDVLTATPCSSASDIQNINITRSASPPISSTSIFSKIIRGLVFSVTSLCLISRRYLAGDSFEILIISNPPFIGLIGLVCKYLGFLVGFPSTIRGFAEETNWLSSPCFLADDKIRSRIGSVYFSKLSVLEIWSFASFSSRH